MLKPTIQPLRMMQSLSGFWRWNIKDDEGALLDEGLIYLPGVFAPHPKLKNHVGALLLHRTFTIPALMMEQRLLLYIGSAYYGLVVFVNGKPVFTTEDHNISAIAPINDLVEIGENRLDIYLSNQPVRSMPSFPGGIDGDMYLLTTPWSFIEDIKWWINDDMFYGKASTLGEADELHWLLSENDKEWVSGQGKHINIPLPSPLKEDTLYTLDLYLLHQDLPIDTYRLYLRRPPNWETLNTYVMGKNTVDFSNLPENRAVLVAGQAGEDTWQDLLFWENTPFLLAIDPPWKPDPYAFTTDRLIHHLEHLIDRYHHLSNVMAWILPKNIDHSEVAALSSIVTQKDPQQRPVGIWVNDQLKIYPVDHTKKDICIKILKFDDKA